VPAPTVAPKPKVKFVKTMLGQLVVGLLVIVGVVSLMVLDISILIMVGEVVSRHVFHDPCDGITALGIGIISMIVPVVLIGLSGSIGEDLVRDME
jgi:hypothetical protein